MVSELRSLGAGAPAPVVQALVLAVVFSKIARFDTGGWSYTTFVMSGIFAWAYVSGTAMAATTSVVEGASLADKVWFPRAVLALVPVLANGVGSSAERRGGQECVRKCRSRWSADH